MAFMYTLAASVVWVIASILAVGIASFAMILFYGIEKYHQRTALADDHAKRLASLSVQKFVVLYPLNVMRFYRLLPGYAVAHAFSYVLGALALGNQMLVVMFIMGMFNAYGRSKRLANA